VFCVAVTSVADGTFIHDCVAWVLFLLSYPAIWLCDRLVALGMFTADNVMPGMAIVLVYWICVGAVVGLLWPSIGRVLGLTRPSVPESQLPTCQTCGYSLKGLPEPRCPECGTPFGQESAIGDESPNSGQ
jgi:hypothetical protein